MNCRSYTAPCNVWRSLLLGLDWLDAEEVHTRIRCWSRLGSVAVSAGPLALVSGGNATTATRQSHWGTKNRPKWVPFLHPTFLLYIVRRPPNGGRISAPVLERRLEWVCKNFVGPISVLGRHRRRRQDILGRQTSEGHNPVFSKSLHPFLRRCTSRRSSHERHTFKTYRSPAVSVLGSVSEPGHLPHMEAWS